MNKGQKEAWIGLLLVVPLWAVFGQLPILLIYAEGPSLLHLLSFAAATIVGGLSWVFILFFNKTRKRKTKVGFDERDRLIFIRATLAAYVALWLYFVAACTFAWLYAAPDRSISVNVMPMVVVEGIAVFVFVQSLATLIQYGRGGEGGE